MDVVKNGAVLMAALGMLARDTKSLIPLGMREEIQGLLRMVHALGIPLLLSDEERLRYREPLLRYLHEHRPRIVVIVAAVLDEKESR